MHTQITEAPQDFPRGIKSGLGALNSKPPGLHRHRDGKEGIIYGIFTCRKYLLEVKDYLLPMKSSEGTLRDSLMQTGYACKEGHGASCTSRHSTPLWFCWSVLSLEGLTCSLEFRAMKTPSASFESGNFGR